MTDLAVWVDGYHVDDAGNVIYILYVDLRPPTARVSTTALVKSSRREHGIDIGRTIRIATAEYYREHGEGTMRDTSEGKASHTSRQSSTVDDPADLAEARLDDRELNRAMELAGGTPKVTSNTTSVRRSRRATDSITYGKNCWIFCTSIEPSTDAERDAWQKAMHPAYDYRSHIYRPRGFARALASMVAEQLGPQGQEAKVTHKYDDVEQSATHHKSQLVLHGPVLYVDDPYEALSSASSDGKRMMMSVFLKHRKFRAEREYRFAVWAEEAPAADPVNLDVSLEMLGALQPLSDEPTSFFLVTPQRESQEVMERDLSSTPSAHLNPASFPSLHDLADQPSTLIAPYKYSSDDPPAGLHRALTTYSAIRALRSRSGPPHG